MAPKICKMYDVALILKSLGTPSLTQTNDVLKGYNVGMLLLTLCVGQEKFKWNKNVGERVWGLSSIQAKVLIQIHV